MEYSVVEGLLFGATNKTVLTMVHPNHQMGRNAQHVMNDFMCFLATRICKECEKKQVSFSKESMTAVVTGILPDNEISKFALREIEKDKRAGQLDHIRPPLLAFVADKFPQLSEKGKGKGGEEEWNDGIDSFSAVLDYFCAEVFELSGNAASNLRLETMNIGNICSAVAADEELNAIFKGYSFGYLMPVFFMTGYSCFTGALDRVKKFLAVEDHVSELSSRHRLQIVRKENDFVDNQVGRR